MRTKTERFGKVASVCYPQPIAATGRSGHDNVADVANRTTTLQSHCMAISISYSSRRHEVWRWYWQTWRRSLWKIHLPVFLAVAGTATLALPKRPASFAIAGLIGIVPLIGFVLFPMLKFKPQQRTLTVDDTGIETAVGTIQAFVPWQDVAEILEDGDYLIIQRTNQNAFIVPGRAFCNPASRTAFRDFIRSKVGAVVR